MKEYPHFPKSSERANYYDHLGYKIIPNPALSYNQIFPNRDKKEVHMSFSAFHRYIFGCAAIGLLTEQHAFDIIARNSIKLVHDQINWKHHQVLQKLDIPHQSDFAQIFN